MPLTLAAPSGLIYFQNADAVICLDATTGQLLWKAPRPVHRRRLAWSTPTLVVRDGVVFSADRRAATTDGALLWIPSGGYHEYIRGDDAEGELIAFDARTGERLWSGLAYEGFNAPVDVLIADQLLWTGQYAWGNDPGITEARDPKTGQVCRQRPADSEFLPRIGHARCHRAKATPRYLILGRRGVEFVDLETGHMVANFWIRGICHYGVLPANGLLYVPPHSCACSVTDLLKCGFMALAPEEPSTGGSTSPDASQKPADGGQLERGIAYEDSASEQSTVDSQQSDDWPTYRHDASRSGVTPARIPRDLRVAWRTQLGGKLTSPVIANGVLLVAAHDAHRVEALDAVTGDRIWTFIAGARIDSPPTIHQDRALFGSADGRVYCVRLKDGKLIWRFQAAPRDRRLVVNDQLESPWPISGSVLVVDDAVFFVAGRTSYLDGGMRLYKLDVATGKTLGALKLEVEKQRRDGGFASGGYLPDILSADDKSVFLRRARFDRSLVRQEDDVPHLWSSVGFLEDSWWHRTYWQFGTTMSSGWGGWAKAGQQVPAGRLLVIDDTRVFGYGRNQYDTPGSHVGVDADGVWGPIGREMGRWTYYRLFARSLSKQTDRAKRRKAKPSASEWVWTSRVPVLAHGMVLAGQTLFVAGPDDPVSEIPKEPRGVDPLVEALETTEGGRLLVVAAADGKTLADYELPSPPVFDGVAAARDRLYLSTKAGDVVCMGSAE
jgi:outer membrane protein assembly factor BamB